MASFGAKFPCFKPHGAEKGVVLSKLVSANLTVNLASGEMYADDSLAEQASEFVSSSIALETDDMEDSEAAVLYGCKVEDNIVTYNAGDTAPRGRHGYYKVLMRNGKKFFKAYYYPDVRAALGNDNAQTKGSSITFSSTSTTLTVFADKNGDWRKTATFDNEEEARAWISELCGISTQTEDTTGNGGQTEGTE